MALIVEDGTGLASAESYASVAEAKAYWTARVPKFGDISALSDVTIEGALREATQYIDGRYRFRDVRLLTTQALSFPRSAAAVDYDGQPIPALPARVKSSTIELAFVASDGTDLLPASDRGGLIKSETIGPLSTTYMDSAPPGPAYLTVDNFLRPYVRLDVNPPLGINMGPEYAPFMATDLHDSLSGPIPGADEQDVNSGTS